jgi:hypothetical protein
MYTVPLLLDIDSILVSSPMSCLFYVPGTILDQLETLDLE